MGRTDRADPCTAGRARSWGIYTDWAQYTALYSTGVSHGSHEGVGWPARPSCRFV
ncbi:predicted protein [Streptomyces viridosporus ATCC 14672]|uniref:Predicted protein n=1 Tax=Streptomyces viridosporus (strain ATCC 14672 / DSM 40746 / JCM 4963 / KCTC 9882 / NRRL B-12104 / FH 1290) TaxID=566461 RepID=D5ZP51_STRV1|nr:predicted protein [Streptomyces viridosporus ATCC 14672]